MRKSVRRFVGVALALAVAGAVLGGEAGIGVGATPARAASPVRTDPDEGMVNLATVARVSTSYVSGHETLGAVNDGVVKGRGIRHYGNWPEGGTQWVEYEWPKAISTNRVDIVWWADGRGIHLPKGYRVKYWDGEKYAEVPNAKGMGMEANTFNVTTFDEVKTTRIRVEMDAAGGKEISTGITEFRVLDSGNSPAFAPTVVAGMDRRAVVGGKTYLTPVVRTLGGGQGVTYAWTKAEGPGEVTFADASAKETTASFETPGDYTLKLTASVGGEKGGDSSSDVVHVTVVPAAPAQHADSVFTRHYEVDSPLWNARLKAMITHWIPHCVNYLEHPEKHLNPPGSRDPIFGAGGIDDFIEAGKKLRGEPAKRHVGPPWANAYVYNTLESMCYALTVDAKGDPEMLKAQADMRATIDRWIPIILAAQEPDGYIQTLFTLDGMPHWNPRTRGDHEGYVAGYFLDAAIADYVATDGKDMRMYNAAKKLADCWYTNVGPGSSNKWFDGHQEIEQSLVHFARLVDQVEGPHTGDKYVMLAKTLLDNRRGGTSYDQSQCAVVEQYEALGHAVRAAYTYSGMAAVSEETGNLDYQSAVQSLWDSIVNKKYYVTGGIGSGETSEGFGPNYSLRNNSYCESCSNCGELFFQYSLNLQYQDARYADLYEETLYNAILGDTDLVGDNYCYTNPLDQTSTAEHPARYRWHDCPCCVGNIPRVLLQLPTWMYTTTPDSLAVNLFIGSKCTVPGVGGVAGTTVEMEQQTDYPWKGEVALTVNPEKPAAFTLKVRVPDRGVSTLYQNTPTGGGMIGLKVNGEPVEMKVEKGYALIDRTWKAGDRVTFTLPLQVQVVKADERIAADRGLMALRYGPLVYNLETADQQDVEKPVAAQQAFEPVWRGQMLDGIVAIEGKFADGSPLVAVPNYARLNRGGRSLVWMREAKAEAK